MPVNPATEFVQSTANHSPVHAYVADEGVPICRDDIEHVTIAGRSIAVSKALTSDERSMVAEAIRATEPAPKVCFGNSMRMWQFDSRFEYTEGYAVTSEFDIGGFEHAWCMLDGEKLVDVTIEFDDYHGVVITDTDTLQRHAREHFSYAIIGNHRNRFEYLRERGYFNG